MMTPIDSPELGRLVHECVPRMIVALGMPRSMARAIAERGGSPLIVRERLSSVREDAWLLAKQRWAKGERAAAVHAEQFATIAGLLALVLDVHEHDAGLADSMLDRAIVLCESWASVEAASRATPSARSYEGWLNRWFVGRNKPATMS